MSKCWVSGSRRRLLSPYSKAIEESMLSYRVCPLTPPSRTPRSPSRSASARGIQDSYWKSRSSVSSTSSPRLSSLSNTKRGPAGDVAGVQGHALDEVVVVGEKGFQRLCASVMGPSQGQDHPVQQTPVVMDSGLALRAPRNDGVSLPDRQITSLYQNTLIAMSTLSAKNISLPFFRTP